MKRIFSLLTLTLCVLQLAAKAPKHTSAYYLTWAERFAQSQMAHDPKLSMADGVKAPKWDYTQALLAKSVLQTYKQTGKEEYLKYVLEFADYFIPGNGSIETYKLEDFNIDRVNGGSFLFPLLEIMPEERYREAIELLYKQLCEQPRTSEGGFWHKKIYPYQMWLDGLYMGEPFYARYAVENKKTELLDDVLLQFRTVDQHTYDPKSGLNYHGWDESRKQLWADPETGCSPNFWGRSMGWYLMAMVDVLDVMPKDHPAYNEILGMLQRSAKNILRYQDKKSRMWYQVLDKQDAPGNYLETTCSAIFCYTFIKGANRGFLPASYKKEAQRIFDGIIAKKVVDDGQWWDLTGCCAVAGLGGKPYRSGSYSYYINEPIRSNDPKGVGPMILAALELAR